MWIRLAILLLCPTLILFANLESYLKPALNKEGAVSCVEGIDFIYLINLDQRPEKYSSCLQELKPYNINPYRFSAVNGWEIPIDQINGLGICFERGMTRSIMGTNYDVNEGGAPHHAMISKEGEYYFSHCMSRGAIGIVLSHLSVLQDAYDSGYETVWIMEDDIEVIQDPHLVSQRIKEMDNLFPGKDWDVLFTDFDTKDKKGKYVSCCATCKRPNFTPEDPRFFFKRNRLSSSLREIGARYGAYSYIIRRSGMEKILNFYKKYSIFLPFDIDIFMIPRIRMFTVIQDIVSTQPEALSDNGGQNYSTQ